MKTRRNQLNMTFVEWVSFISGLITISNALLKNTGRFFKRGNNDLKVDKILKLVSWILIIIALLSSLPISATVFVLGLYMNASPVLSLLLAISIPLAVLIPTVMQAYEDKILTIFMRQASNK